MKATVFVLGQCLLLIFLASSCCTTPPCMAKGGGDEAMDLARKLDYVEKSIEQFGTISASCPYVIRPPEAFKFDLGMSAKDFYNAQRIQGSVGISQQSSVDFQFTLNAQLEDLVKSLQALGAAKTPSAGQELIGKIAKSAQSVETLQSVVTNLSGLLPATTAASPAVQAALGIANGVLQRAATASADSGTTAPAASSSNAAAPTPVTAPTLTKDERVALATLSDTKFSAPFTLANETTSLSPSDLLVLSAGDKNRQDILTWLANPSSADLGPNKIVYLCILTISCQPGWATSEDYAAEIMMTPRYVDQFGKKFATTDGTPGVAAIYPMVDSQVLDLKSSLRQQRSLAMKLGASGYGAAAQAFLDYANRLEKDAKAPMPVTTCSGFCRDGSTVGFRVEPRFVAISDLQKKKAETGMKMEARNFPAMVLLVCDSNEIDPDCGGTAENLAGATQVSFEMETRWIPIGKDAKCLRRLPETEYVARAQCIDEVREKIRAELGVGQAEKVSRAVTDEINKKKPAADKAAQLHEGQADARPEVVESTKFTKRLPERAAKPEGGGPSKDETIVWQTLERRARMLMDSACGTWISQALPQRDTAPHLVFPGVAASESVSLFVLSGKGLADIAKAVYIGGDAYTDLIKIDTDRNIVGVMCKGWSVKDKDTVGVPVAVQTDSWTVWAGSVTFKADPKAAEKKKRVAKPGEPHTADSTVIVDRDGAGNITKVKLDGPYQDDTMNVLKTISSALGGPSKASCCWKMKEK